MKVIVHAADHTVSNKVYFNLEEYKIPFGEPVDLPEGVVQMLLMNGTPVRGEKGEQTYYAHNYNVVHLEKEKPAMVSNKGGKSNDSSILN